MVKKGTTALLVSHDLGMVEGYCDNGILMDEGEIIIKEGKDVIKEYKR